MEAFFASILGKQKNIGKKSIKTSKSYKNLYFNIRKFDNNKNDIKIENKLNLFKNNCDPRKNSNNIVE